MNIVNYLTINNEVQTALDANKPIVALESTIIAHGMPYPENVKVALKIEQLIRDNGAVPATIALINGQLKVGLTKEEIMQLGQKGHKVTKTSRRDIPYVLSTKVMGATTVAATMFIANLVKIKVFATGGIGGVHKNGQNTFDISADLEELSKTSMAVVCAGVKSILDLPLTLEYLETKGVPVIGYQSDVLPAFYARKSNHKLQMRFDNPQTIANFLKIKWTVGLKGGVVIANPIPQKDSMNQKEIEDIINKALIVANKQKITGKEITPFLLGAIKKETQGKSLSANIALVYNNAILAAQISKCFI